MIRLLLIIISVVRIGIECQAQTNLTKIRLSPEITPAYQSAALDAMVLEANKYALSLALPEKMPITTNSLTEIHISPPAFAARFGGLGSFKTEKFSYAFGRGKRLAYITRLISVEDSKKSLYEANKHLAITPALVNTNAAYLLATQWLQKAFINVGKLTESSSVSVRPWEILDIVTAKYTVEWLRAGKPIAQVTLIEPTKELLVLRVEDPEYILRPAVAIIAKESGKDGLQR